MRRRTKWILGGLFLAVVAALIVRGRIGSGEADQRGGAGGGRGGGGGPVPVVTAEVEAHDMPIYLQGIGSAQAYQSVTVRTRIDGQLDKVLFREGQEVKAGELLAQIDPRPLQAQLGQVTAKKAQDAAALVSARKDLERYQQLVAQKLLQQQMLDQQTAAVGQLEATVRGDQAAIDSVAVQLSYTRITAPIAGRVGIRQVDPGNIVRASDANGLVMITQLEPISVIFTLPEQFVGEVNAQQTKAALEVDALAPQADTLLEKGELLLVDNQIDPTTGTVRLKAVFANADRKLWPGQFVNARLLLETRKGALTVPAPALQRGPNGTFVYVIKDGAAQMRQVQAGVIEAGRAIIDAGLEVGEKVVVDGQYKLQPGSKVSEGGGGQGAGPQGDGQKGPRGSGGARGQVGQGGSGVGAPPGTPQGAAHGRQGGARP